MKPEQLATRNHPCYVIGSVQIYSRGQGRNSEGKGDLGSGLQHRGRQDDKTTGRNVDRSLQVCVYVRVFLLGDDSGSMVGRTEQRVGS